MQRAALEVDERAQVDAGLAFGMSRPLIMRRIILPQAVRRMLPPMTSQFISIVKDSSLAGTIGVMFVMPAMLFGRRTSKRKKWGVFRWLRRKPPAAPAAA